MAYKYDVTIYDDISNKFIIVEYIAVLNLAIFSNVLKINNKLYQGVFPRFYESLLELFL